MPKNDNCALGKLSGQTGGLGGVGLSVMNRSVITALLVFIGCCFANAEETLFQAKPLTEEGLFTGGIEGPACDAKGILYCVKFGGEHTIGKVTPDGKAELFVNLPEGSTANGIRFGNNGDMYVADYTGHNVLLIDPVSKAISVFAHEPTMSQPNDLAIMADGVLYASDPDWKNKTGQIWRIDRQGKMTRVAADMGTTNGIDISPDGKTLYVNESVQRKIWAFTIAADGSLTGKRRIKEFPDFGFDGMRIDVDGNLYISRHGKGTVIKMTPKGEVLQEIAVLGANPSNVCFGGPDGRTVYVTEMEKRRVVQFRVDKPGLEWKRMKDRQAALDEPQPPTIKRVVAVPDVCAWPNLTLMSDGSVTAILHNQPGHGTLEGDIDCWASADGLAWEKRSTITQHEPGTIRMNHAAGLAKNGDLVVICSGWTDHKQAERPKQPKFRDAVIENWVLRSKDGGRTWEKRAAFPRPEAGWTEQIPFGDIWLGADGALHTSCYQGLLAEPTKSFKTKSYRSWHFRSADDGWTWAPVSIIGPRHNETDIFPLGGRSWLAAARVEAMDLFRSDDNGVTWHEPLRVTDRNEINGHLARLKDGRLLLTYGVRIAGRQGVCAKLSTDNGKTWGKTLRLAHSASGDCGYPSSVQLANGKIVTAYYSRDAPEHAGYHMGSAVWEAP
ncbi:MAG: SMP-30/gluconolactonase/LRE family protein [Prosthecobacter sp.]|nr:SMP-30/gluconolactonase/LRE family protein [Prosthecobacter sp.]